MSYGMSPYDGHMTAPNPEELQDFVAHAGEPLEAGHRGCEPGIDR